MRRRNDVGRACCTCWGPNTLRLYVRCRILSVCRAGEDLVDCLSLHLKHHRIPTGKMPVVQGLLKGSSLSQGCVSHQQTRVPGRLPFSRRSPSSRLSLNVRTQLPAPSQLNSSSARSCRRQFQQRKQSCSCPHFSGCGCRQTTVCGAGTAHPEEVSLSDMHC